jgi:serine/threonine-protein kinase
MGLLSRDVACLSHQLSSLEVVDNLSEQVKDPMVGALFANRYSIDRLKARSSMSVVYRAIDTVENVRVAIKLLNGLLVDDEESMQRFHREAQISRSLAHPNVCALLDHGVTADGTPYQILEYVDGENLEEILSAVGCLNPVEALPIFVKTCRAVQYLHTRGVVHRDLKPANLMVPFSDAELSVKVIDFGVAKGARSGVHHSVELTGPGEVLGSLLYTAPERLSGHKADTRSDIYSLGCLIYESLTGVNPFSADEPGAIVEMQLKLHPPALQSNGLTPKVAMLFQPIVSKALEKNPNLRYQSAAEMKAALEKLDKPLRIMYSANSAWRDKRSMAEKIIRRITIVTACLIGGSGVIVMVILLVHRLRQSGLTFLPHW